MSISYLITDYLESLLGFFNLYHCGPSHLILVRCAAERGLYQGHFFAVYQTYSKTSRDDLLLATHVPAQVQKQKSMA